MSIENLKTAEAQAMLASTQQLRTHWSGVITSHLTLAVTINVALWSYFGMAFIDSLKYTAGIKMLFLYSASSLSTFLVGLWRIYTRHIDDHIAHLYPDFLLYEEKLGVPYDRGTSGYLIKAVPRLSSLLENKQLTPEVKIKAIASLVNMKRAGDRGHKIIDLIVLCLYVIPLAIFSAWVYWEYYYGLNIYMLFLAGNFAGFILIIRSLKKYQRNPCEGQIKELLQRYRQKET